jgi:hypothetical protein
MHVDLDMADIKATAAEMAAENEAALAACAEHDFAALNSRSPSHYACRRCKGVIGHDAYRQHQQGRP